MAVEIERRFLVRDIAFLGDAPGVAITQGYLARSESVNVRVRITRSGGGSSAFLTVKSAGAGIARDEFEYPLPLGDAEALLRLCTLGRIDKTRHRRVVAGSVFEIDVFLGANAPLVLAEIELPAVDAPFATPPWLGDEVTGNPRYTNANLARDPLQSWPKPE